MKPITFLLCMLLTIVAYGQAPVISDFNPKIATAGSNITLTGSDFSSTSASNVVHFGTVPATVVSSSANSLVVEVPIGTKADKINVLNTATGLSGQTMSNFYPTFDGGARIIPASFLPHQDLTVSASARTVRMVDVDGDGWLDIVAVSSQGISIFRNLGNGGSLSGASFAPSIGLNSGLVDTGGSNMNDFGFTDLDNDGKPDLYFSLDGSSTFGFGGAVGIYRNISTAGTISFESVTLLDVVPRITHVAAGDFDGDGRQELLGKSGAACGAGPSTDFIIFKNLSTPGNLAFGSNVDITPVAGTCFYHRSIITDLNNDNKLDIAVTRGLFSEFTSLILNQSAPGVIDENTFAPSPDLVNGGSTLALSDFDGDDLPEFITHNEANNTGIALRPNTSSGGNLDFADSIPYFTNIFNEGETAVSDVNGDGQKDLVMGTRVSQGWISILENDFDGAWDEFSFKQPVRFKTNSGFTSTIDVGDLNHDGRPDLVTANQAAFLSIIENAVQFPPQIQNVSSYQAQTGETITITGQHFSLSTSENIVRFGGVLANVISATSTELVVEVPLGAAYDYITVGADIFTAISPQRFSVVSGAGNGFDANSFAPPVAIATTGDVNDVMAGDVDNDGKVDLLARDGSSLLLLKNQATTDVIVPSSFQNIPSTVDLFVQPGRLVDLNGDGYLDLMTQSRVYFNSSQTASEPIEFQDQTTLFTGNSTSFTLTDFNRDGILDNVQTLSSGSTVSINEGVYGYAPFGTVNGAPDQPFLPRELLPKTASNGAVSAADFDGDGFPDIAASNPNTDNVSFFRNLGSTDIILETGFSAAQNFAVGDNPTQVVAGDLDLDGKTDLAVINQNDNSVTVLHNQSTIGNLAFDTYTYSVSASPRLLRLHDLDGDAKPEIVTVNAFLSGVGGTFSVLKNNAASMDASSFAVEQLYTRSNNTVPANFVIADLDDDNRADIILTSTNPDQIVIYKNQITIGASITISSQPQPVSSCTGENALFSITASGTTNLAYQWQVDTGGGFSDLSDDATYSGTQTNELTITDVTLSLDDNLYRCVITGDNATPVNSNSAILNVNSVATPTITANGPLTFCEGGSVILSGPGGFAEYLWSTGETTQDITVSTTASITLRVSDGRCLSGLSAMVNVTVNDAPDPPTIIVSGNTELCDGEQTTLLGPDGFDTYQWSNGATAQSTIIITTQTVTLVVGNKGCLSLASAPVNIIVNDVPDTPGITASGSTDLCQGESVTLIGPDGFAVYQWSNGASTRSITVTSALIVTLIVSDGSCPSPPSAPVNVTVSNRPDQPQITVTGGTEICEGEQATLSGPNGFDLYQWSNGETTQSISVNNTGILTLTVGNGGCLSIPSEPVSITVIDAPETPDIEVLGLTELCEGETVVLSGPNGFSIYEWSNGATTQSIEVNISANITLRVGNGGCLSVPSNPVTVTVFEVPGPPRITLSGPSTLCDGDIVTLSGPDGFNTYNWSNGASTQSIEVRNAGTFSLTVANGPCESIPSEPVTIEVGVAPEIPEITVEGNFLVAPTGATRYQWYDNGEPLERAITRYLELDLFTFGNYTVEVWVGTCSAVSLPFTFIVTSFDGLAKANRPVIFPVPFERGLSIANLGQWHGATIALYGMNGEKLFRTHIGERLNDRITIDTQRWQAGTYLIILQKEEHIYWQRIVKY